MHCSMGSSWWPPRSSSGGSFAPPIAEASRLRNAPPARATAHRTKTPQKTAPHPTPDNTRRQLHQRVLHVENLVEPGPEHIPLAATPGVLFQHQLHPSQPQTPQDCNLTHPETQGN